MGFGPPGTYVKFRSHRVLKATLENLSEVRNAFSPPGGMVVRCVHVGHSTVLLLRDILTRLSKQSRQMEWRQGRTTGSSMYSAPLPHSLHSKKFCRVTGRCRLKGLSVAMVTAVISSISKLRIMNTACLFFRFCMRILVRRFNTGTADHSYWVVNWEPSDHGLCRCDNLAVCRTRDFLS